MMGVFFFGGGGGGRERERTLDIDPPLLSPATPNSYFCRHLTLRHRCWAGKEDLP